MTLNVLDLFCGCGGLSDGFRNAGANIVVGGDNDGVALDTFRYNFPESVGLEIDLFSKTDVECVIETSKKHNVNIIVGGPPCQG